ncbi:pleiotropic drug resistance protein 1-like [Daucus carota subsp. sativus]|uniref:pleiotropic drug resistance protein 1-like n=1 Tax=Daucus carota subsp. sativus TaxID=79200 RepID=UPI00308310EE
MLAELSRREKNANIKPDPDLVIFMKAVATKGQESNVVTDYVLKVYLTSGQQHHLIVSTQKYKKISRCLHLGLDTLVGNQMIRGISGGQKSVLQQARC